MKIVIAPDSYKDAMRADASALHIATGFQRVAPALAVELCPVADGGEGFADAIAQSRRADAGTRVERTADALGLAIDARWVLLRPADRRPTAIIELAEASGLERLKQAERDPMCTSTHGSGQLIRQALEHGPAELLVGIGGSATNDAACGIAQVLGVRFYNEAGEELVAPITGGDLTHIARIDTASLDERLANCTLRVACDVDNPLTGPNGAAHVYGPQKGATPEQVEQLDAGLRHIAELWREQLGVDVEHLPGAGAAGGVGGGLVAMLGAELVPGAELVLDTIHFDDRIKDADLVITGEGRLDAQSLSGKAVMAVAKRAKAAGVPCVALVGSVGEGAQRMLEHGLSDILVIGEGLDPAESIRRTGELLEHAAARLARERLN
jgi:glycerate kinase